MTMRILAGYNKLLLAANTEALLRGFEGPATPENIEKLAFRFPLSLEAVSKALMTRPAPRAPSDLDRRVQARAADMPAVTKARARVEDDYVAASWRTPYGRASE